MTVREIIRWGTELDARLGVPETDDLGLDVPGGVAHGNLAYMIHGTFDSPWLISGINSARIT